MCPLIKVNTTKGFAIYPNCSFANIFEFILASLVASLNIIRLLMSLVDSLYINYTASKSKYFRASSKSDEIPQQFILN